MRLFKLLSVLLDYPSDDRLSEIRQAVAAAGGAIGMVSGNDRTQTFSADEHQDIARFLDSLLALNDTQIQADYVQTFDLTANHSLHLTHHLFGEEKTRGPALIDLSEYLKTYGFKHEETELPDYLPLILEFVSELSEDEAKVFLGDAGKVLKVLAANLEKAESIYAPLIRIIDNHGSLVKLAA